MSSSSSSSDLNKYDGPVIAAAFFQPVGPGKFLCKFCPDSDRQYKQESKKGYTNLVTHARSHSKFEEIMNAATTKPTDGGMEKFVRPLSDDAAKIYGWLDLIIANNMPFSACESKMLRKYVHLKDVGRATLSHFRDLIHTEVETIISNEIPETFGLIYDGILRIIHIAT